MMLLSIILFGLAAVGGLVLGIFRFSGSPTPPLALAGVHGVAAALALLTLTIAISTGNATQGAAVALGVLLLAALGGLRLLSQHLKLGRISVPLMVIHATAAVVGFVVLLMNA
jgi:hypothetical protein